MSERSLARRASMMAYAKRICGGIPGAAKSDYAGQFPYQDLAETVPIPETSSLAEHQKLWRELYSNFEQAWRHFDDAHGKAA